MDRHTKKQDEEKTAPVTMPAHRAPEKRPQGGAGVAAYFSRSSPPGKKKQGPKGEVVRPHP